MTVSGGFGLGKENVSAAPHERQPPDTSFEQPEKTTEKRRSKYSPFQLSQSLTLIRTG
jgi:hypothetical protein